jgi:O-antigen/teichoic acid export membrane protein
MFRRIILGFGANAFGQAVNIVIQLASLPLFLLYWDASTYGSWLLLSAVPAYLNWAECGVVGVASNKMTMAMGRSDPVEANNLYQSAQLFMTIVCGSLALIVVPGTLFLPMPDFMTEDKRIALAALFLGVLCGQYGGLSIAVFRATGRYATGELLGNLVRLSEWSGYALGLILFRSFAGVALLGLFFRASGTAVGIYLGQRGGHGLRLGFRHASKAELLYMVRPAVSFMAFPIANALSFQGVTLIVGVLAGTAAVTLFTAYRTLARVTVQVTGLFSHALWPEFSRLFGQQGMTAVHPLFRRAALIGAAQSIALSLVLFFISPFLLRIWTHGRIGFEPGLMALILTYAAVSGIWHVPRTLLMATNQHIGLAGWLLATGILSVALAWLLGTFWQINGVGAAMLISESFIAAICIYLAQNAFAEAVPETAYSS